MPERLKNILIGFFVLAAFAIVIFILLFLHPVVGDDGQILHVRFNDIDKVSKGTRVTFAGRPVGEVTHIYEVPDARIEQQYRKGGVYIYELTLRIDSGIEVYESDDISLRTSGLLGERSIEISPRPAPPSHFLRRVTDKDVIFASTPTSVEEALTSINAVAGKIGKAFDSFAEQVHEMKNIKLIDKVGKIADNIKDITDALNQPAELDAIVKNFNQFTQGLLDIEDRFNETWTNVDTSVNNFVASSENFKGITVTGNNLMSNIAKGEGTVGKLLAKEEFYLRLNSVISKADIAMNDINHYGLLFHTDKNWQRLRARRVNLMQQLQSPQEFSNFFHDEIGTISTALSRVNMVFQQTADQCDPQYAIISNAFGKVFADLLYQVNSLQENLELYNQQMMEMKETIINTSCP